MTLLDWEQRKLGDFGNVGMNKRIFKNQTSDSGEIPFYKIGTFGKKANSFISKKLFEQYKAKYPYPKIGDILISASGSIGRTVVYKGEDAYFQDSNIVWLNHDKQLTNSFLKQFYLIVKWKGLEGSTIKRLYNKDILSTVINVPSVQEQGKIGDIFSMLDNLITLQQRKLSLIKTLKRSFLSDLFFKTSTNSVVITLKQVTSIRGGYAFKSKEFTENGYPIIKIANISNNGEIKGPYSYTNNFNKKYILTKNDIVLAMSGATTGKIAKLRSSKAFLQNQRIGYFCKTNNIDYNYLYYLLISDQFKKQLKRITIAGAQPNVSSSDIENFRFSVLSSKNKQKKISDFLNKLDTKIRITNKKITIFSQLKRSLLNNMFI